MIWLVTDLCSYRFCCNVQQLSTIFRSPQQSQLEFNNLMTSYILYNQIFQRFSQFDKHSVIRHWQVQLFQCYGDEFKITNHDLLQLYIYFLYMSNTIISRCIAQIAPLSFQGSHRTQTQTSEVRWLHASVVTEWSPACLHKQFPGDLHRGN